MCTVTFIARRNGYALGMNRDERLTRVAGLPPRLTHLNGHAILAPSEPSGGTWIGVNDTGAYSTCMHREEAATVSYTEVRVSLHKATMRYTPTAPCCATPTPDIGVRLHR